MADSGLRRVLDRGVLVQDLVSGPLLVVRSDSTPKHVEATMRDRSYDVVGVDTTGDGSADSFLELAALDLGRPIHQVARPLLASFAVERSMPLVDLMPLLHDRAYVFVLDGDRVRHIVTRADLAKPAVGISVLALLLQLEQVLLPRAIDRLGGEWFETLPDAVRTKARQTQERKRGRARRTRIGAVPVLRRRHGTGRLHPGTGPGPRDDGDEVQWHAWEDGGPTKRSGARRLNARQAEADRRARHRRRSPSTG